MFKGNPVVMVINLMKKISVSILNTSSLCKKKCNDRSNKKRCSEVSVHSSNLTIKAGRDWLKLVMIWPCLVMTGK